MASQMSNHNVLIEGRIHNKSGRSTLSILELEDADITEVLEAKVADKAEAQEIAVIANSRCKVWPNVKSKITLKGKVSKWELS